MPTTIPDDLHRTLLAKLDEYRHHTDATPDQGTTTNGHDTTDSEQVLGAILRSDKVDDQEQVQKAIDEYLAGKPLAYITAQHDFGGLDLTVRRPIYIPRVETEQWVLLLARHILSHTPPDRVIRILDICSGSGCIPLLLAKEGKGRIQTVGLDVDDIALEVARENASRNGLDGLSTFQKLDLFSEEDVERLVRAPGMGASFDLVVSNPPYVSSKDMKEVETSWHEGKYALQGKLKRSTLTSQEKKGDQANDNDNDDEDDGYSFYRRILQIYPSFLSPTRPPGIPKLVLEIGSTQSRPVQTMYADQGRMEVYKETERRKDLSAPKLEKGDMVGTERSLWIYADE